LNWLFVHATIVLNILVKKVPEHHRGMNCPPAGIFLFRKGVLSDKAPGREILPERPI
jgi:hypothetical protein